MFSLKVNLKGLDKGERVTKEKAQRILQRTMFKIEEIAVDKAPYDRGYLRENITIFPEILANKYVITSKAPYSADLEFGNTPRDVEFKDIEEWAIRKGIVPESNSEAFVKYVVAKIRTEGVNAQPFMRPAAEEGMKLWFPQFRNEELS